MRNLYFTLMLLLFITNVSAGLKETTTKAVRTAIVGPDIVAAGTATWYTFTQAFVATPSWTITSGTATINSSHSSGNTYSVSVTWTTSGTLYFYDDVSGAEGTKNVTIIATPTVTNGARCGTGTVGLSATTGTGGTKVRWYAAPSGGSILSESNNYTTSSLSSTTDLYVQSYNQTYGVGSARVPVTATIVPIPSVPTDVTGDERCGKGSVTLLATADSPSNAVVWYSSELGGDTVYMGSSFTVPLERPTTFYAASYHVATNCVSTTRVEALANVKEVPDLTVWSYPIMVGPGQTELNTYSYKLVGNSGWYVASEHLDVDLDTARYKTYWYATESDAEADESRIATATSFTTPTINETTTFYVRLHDEEIDCTGDVTKAVAKVIPLVTNASVRTDVVRVAGKKTSVSLSTLTDSEKTTTFSYLDGLGRVQQTTVLRGSPSGQDIVMPYEYNAVGQASKAYLPYTDTTTTGVFHSGYKLEQQKFFLAASDKIADDSAAYAVAVYEESPRGLVLEQGSVGKGFQPGQGHSSHAAYSVNTATDYVRKFDGKGNSTTWHPAKALTKTTGTNAEDNHTITFADGTGRTVLVRQWIDAPVEGTYTEYLETYYLYNDLGQVTYIISPKGTAELKANSWTFSTTIKDSYCNQFKYDSKGRVTEKKVPGQAWQYIIYDPLDRVVLTQDGLLRPDNKWMFIKYDYRGNAVMTGIHINTTYTTRAALQAYADGLYVSGHASFGADAWYEKPGSTLEGYTSQSFPNTNIEVLSVNYFDDYDFDNSGTADASYVTEGITGEHAVAPYTLGYATGSKRKILGTGTWLLTYVFYDDRGRTIQVHSTNPLNTGSLDRVTNAYADDGRVLYTKKFHNGPDTVTVRNRFEYTTRGDLRNVYQANRGSGYQLVAQYEYNELGQLVDKKLHHTGGSNFLQSVDYRYTIRGQLKSINNSELAGNSSNDDPDSDQDDYFGMELLYNETESGLTTTQRYDGMLSALKWKSPGAASGSTGQKSYAYNYDKSGRLETAAYAVKGAGAWNQETGAQDEAMTYDHNGNILTLQRKQRKYDDLTASYTNETIDNLTYAYKSADKNSLEKITDAALTAGFNNGSSSTSNDYTYDANGNLLSDKNKGIDSIKYNFLGKPVRMKFSDGKVITYVYDAGGSKVTQKLYHGDTLKNTTDYVNGFVYENGALSFFGSPEGRVVNNSGTLQYEYAISDHQGNTRVVFTSVAPAPDEPETGFEAGSSSEFINYTNRSSLSEMNHTTSGTYSQLLHGGYNAQVGAAKTIHVYPGDTIQAEVYAKYRNTTGTASNLTGFATALTGAFGVTSSSVGEALNAYTGLNNYGAMLATGDREDDDDEVPKGFITIMLFDKHHNFLDAAWDQMDDYEQTSTPPAKDPFDVLFKQVVIREEGYVYIFVSNENPTKVDIHFDDLKITHVKSNVIQYNEYYPFGLQTSTSWTREETKDNNYLYNAANELNKTSGWYEMFYRGYDPAIGRMLQVDPYATMYASYTTYNYAVNNPVMMNDPNGGQVSIQGALNSIVPTSRHTANIYANWGEDWTAGMAQSFIMGSQSLSEALRWYDGGGGSGGGGLAAYSVGFYSISGEDANWVELASFEIPEGIYSDIEISWEGLKHYLAIVAGESSDNIDEASAIGSVILNRLALQKKNMQEDLTTKLGGKGQFNAIGEDIYNEVMGYSDDVILSILTNKDYSLKGKYADRFMGAMGPILNGRDYSSGSYFFNATSQRYSTKDIGDNWRAYNAGTFVITLAYGGTTFFKYADKNKKPYP